MFYSEQRQISGFVIRHQPKEQDKQDKKILIQDDASALACCFHLCYQSMKEPALNTMYHRSLQKHSLPFARIPLSALKMSYEISVPQLLHSSALCPSLWQLAQDRERVLLWWLE